MAEFELIDRRALGIGKAKREIFDIPEYADGWNSAIEVIDNAPTIEAKPVVHAHWIIHKEDKNNSYYQCSHCTYGYRTNSIFPCVKKYCSDCGAQMDEVASDNNVGSKVEEVSK